MTRRCCTNILTKRCFVKFPYTSIYRSFYIPPTQILNLTLVKVGKIKPFHHRPTFRHRGLCELDHSGIGREGRDSPFNLLSWVQKVNMYGYRSNLWQHTFSTDPVVESIFHFSFFLGCRWPEVSCLYTWTNPTPTPVWIFRSTFPSRLYPKLPPWRTVRLPVLSTYIRCLLRLVHDYVSPSLGLDILSPGVSTDIYP